MKDSEAQNLRAKKPWAEGRAAIRPKGINLTEVQVVKTTSLQPGQPLPLVVSPNIDGVNLATWARDNRESIEHSLAHHGGILFRGFGVETQADFEQVVEATCARLMQYQEGATPRTQLSEKTYTSTEFPADQVIALHNELSYTNTWPMKIYFFCLTPALQGGETPIADVRKVFARIDPAIREAFIRKGWMLVRNYGDGLGLPWQSVFHTTSKAEVEGYCRQNAIDFEWKDENRLRTRQVRPAAVKHPRTGDMLWFNHIAFWHVLSLDPKVRDVLLAEFGEEDLPYNTFYGDGSPIEAAVVDHLRWAYQQETVAFPWQPGDVLMLDNMLVAHGRNTFTGPRKILVSMGEPCNRGDLLTD